MSTENKPKEGDTYACQQCEMEILVTKPRNCEDGAPFFSCCGEQMQKN